jgi:hypothetical protein
VKTIRCAVAAIIVCAVSACGSGPAQKAKALALPRASTSAAPTSADTVPSSEPTADLTEPPVQLPLADTSSPAASFYSLIRALGARAPIQTDQLVPFVDSFTEAEAKADLASSGLIVLRVAHALLTPSNDGGSDFTRVGFSMSGTWCFKGGKCKTGNVERTYESYRLSGGQWLADQGLLENILAGPTT